MKSKYQEIFKKRVVHHLLFWTVLIVYSIFFFGYPNHLWVWTKLTFLYLPGDIGFVYFTIYYLLPKFLLKKNYVLFVLLFLLFGYLDEIVGRTLYYQILYSGNDFTLKDIFVGKGAFNLFTNYYFALIAIALRLVRIWFKENKLAKKNMQEKFDAELKLKEIEHNMLKAQLHPHFLFNTLNNLYGLTLEKSDKAPEIVLKMSNLLSYMLYECNAPLVPLNKEIEQVLNYISLEQMRYDDDLTIKIENDCISTSLNVAPLLVLPFVENCFKHGTSENVGLSWINIVFKCNNDTFYLSIENSVSEQSDRSVSDPSEGIGLKNVKQRLEALYPNNYKLEINNFVNMFSVSLKLTLCQ